MSKTPTTTIDPIVQAYSIYESTLTFAIDGLGFVLTALANSEMGDPIQPDELFAVLISLHGDIKRGYEEGEEVRG